MKDQPRKSGPGRRAGAVALLAAGAIGGGLLAGTLTASAASSSPSATSRASAAVASTMAPRGPGGAAPVRGDEKAVSAASAATLRAAAMKAVPGGSVYRIETDAGDGTYEAHMTKADGALVTVKFNSSLKVSKVESGMGAGDPAPAGQGQPGTTG